MLKAKIKHFQLVSTNCLDFTIELLRELSGICYLKHLILLDETAKDSWIRTTDSLSIIGKALCRILYSLLVNQSADLDNTHISGDNHECADYISCLTKDSVASISSCV